MGWFGTSIDDHKTSINEAVHAANSALKNAFEKNGLTIENGFGNPTLKLTLLETAEQLSNGKKRPNSKNAALKMQLSLESVHHTDAVRAVLGSALKQLDNDHITSQTDGTYAKIVVDRSVHTKTDQREGVKAAQSPDKKPAKTESKQIDYYAGLPIKDQVAFAKKVANSIVQNADKIASAVKAAVETAKKAEAAGGEVLTTQTGSSNTTSWQSRQETPKPSGNQRNGGA